MYDMIKGLIDDMANLDKISQKIMDTMYDGNISDSLAIDEILYSVRDRIIENIIVDGEQGQKEYNHETLLSDLIGVTQPYTCAGMGTISADKFMEKWGDRIRAQIVIG